MKKLSDNECDDLRRKLDLVTGALEPFAALCKGSLDEIGGAIIAPTMAVQMIKDARAVLAAVREPVSTDVDTRPRHEIMADLIDARKSIYDLETALNELNERIIDHPCFASLTPDEEENIGGENG